MLIRNSFKFKSYIVVFVVLMYVSVPEHLLTYLCQLLKNNQDFLAMVTRQHTLDSLVARQGRDSLLLLDS